MSRKKDVIKKLYKLKELWEEISELCYEIDDKDKGYCLGEFAEKYPFRLSFDEYPSEIENWIYSLQESYDMKDELIREMIFKHLPHDWLDERMEDIVDEIHFRIDDLEEPQKHIKACINYILDKGEGDPIGIHLLINEYDDGNIWEYYE